MLDVQRDQVCKLALCFYIWDPVSLLGLGDFVDLGITASMYVPLTLLLLMVSVSSSSRATLVSLGEPVNLTDRLCFCWSMGAIVSWTSCENDGCGIDRGPHIVGALWILALACFLERDYCLLVWLPSFKLPNHILLQMFLFHFLGAFLEASK